MIQFNHSYVAIYYYMFLYVLCAFFHSYDVIQMKFIIHTCIIILYVIDYSIILVMLLYNY